MNRVRDVWFLALFILAGLLLRLDFLVPNGFVIDSDEAIVGLMALHIMEGREWPVFYYGQHYMGSLEAIVAAVLFRIFGASNVALQAVPLTFSLLLIPLTYALVRAVAGRVAALSSALFMAVPPAALVVWSAKARGGFIEVVFIGALALYCGVRWVKSGSPKPGHTFLVGALLGLGWWVNNQILFFIAPIGVFFAGKLLWFERVSRWFVHGAAFLIGFFAGGAPYWWYNVTQGFPSFGMFKRAGISDALSHLSGTFSTALPILLGGKRFWQTEDLYPGAATLVLFILGLSVALWAVSRRRELLSLLILRVDTHAPQALFLVLIGACIAIFAASSFGYLVEAPRYLLPIYVGIFPLYGIVTGLIARKSKTLAAGWIALILGVHLASSYYGGRAIPGEPFVFEGDRTAKDHSELIAWLEEKGIEWVKTDYWIGYRLAFETRERVRFLIFQEPHQSRLPEYVNDGRAFGPDRMPFVLVPAESRLVKEALRTMGFQFSVSSASGYEIIHDAVRLESDLNEVPSSEFRVVSEYSPESAFAADDDDLETRWGTGQPQKPGMALRYEPRAIRALRGVRFDLGKWPHDFPRGLQIHIETAEGYDRIVLPAASWRAVRHLIDQGTSFLFSFPAVPVKAIVFTQTGSDPIFDWSIAELTAYE